MPRPSRFDFPPELTPWHPTETDQGEEDSCSKSPIGVGHALYNHTVGNMRWALPKGWLSLKGGTRRVVHTVTAA